MVAQGNRIQIPWHRTRFSLFRRDWCAFCAHVSGPRYAWVAARKKAVRLRQSSRRPLHPGILQLIKKAQQATRSSNAHVAAPEKGRPSKKREAS